MFAVGSVAAVVGGSGVPVESVGIDGIAGRSALWLGSWSISMVISSVVGVFRTVGKLLVVVGGVAVVWVEL